VELRSAGPSGAFSSRRVPRRGTGASNISITRLGQETGPVPKEGLEGLREGRLQPLHVRQGEGMRGGLPWQRQCKGGVVPAHDGDLLVGQPPGTGIGRPGNNRGLGGSAGRGERAEEEDERDKRWRSH